MSSLKFAVAAVSIGVAFFILRRHYKRGSSPPGPSKWPIIGNLLYIPLNDPWLTFTRWKDCYGDIIHLEGLGNSILVLNSFKAVNDLLDKRGNTYSHRPVLTMAGELMGLDNSMPLLPPDKEWKMHRKLARIALSPESVRKYYSIQEDIAALLTSAITKEPEEFISHIRHAAGRVILSVTYGLPVNDPNDKYITHAEATMEIISKAMLPGAYLVDAFPSMKYIPRWFPFTNFFRDGEKGYRMINELTTKPFLHVKEQMKAGNASPSLTESLLSNSEINSDKNFEESVRWMAGALYGAGGETTYSTVLTFVMLMALNPDKLKILHAEMDHVVGSERLPLVTDRSSLPYLEAAIRETLRRYPALPLSIARLTSQDDHYEGYFIPKGTIVFPNVWAISQENHSKYPPDTFAPERFLEPDAPVDPNLYAFGFGRRACPGKYLGENSVFIFIATIVATFDIGPPVDLEGNAEPLGVSFTSGLVSYPEHYRCTIKPRSEARAKLVELRAKQCTT